MPHSRGDFQGEFQVRSLNLVRTKGGAKPPVPGNSVVDLYSYEEALQGRFTWLILGMKGLEFKILGIKVSETTMIL